MITILALTDSDGVLVKGDITKMIKRFDNKTKDGAVIYGSAVFEELGQVPIPDRTNIVVTAYGGRGHAGKTFTANPLHTNTFFVRYPQDAIDFISDNGFLDAFVLGPAEIYKWVQSHVSETVIEIAKLGVRLRVGLPTHNDEFYPHIFSDEFKVKTRSVEAQAANGKQKYFADYDLSIYERV